MGQRAWEGPHSMIFLVGVPRLPSPKRDLLAPEVGHTLESPGPSGILQAGDGSLFLALSLWRELFK